MPSMAIGNAIIVIFHISGPAGAGKWERREVCINGLLDWYPRKAKCAIDFRNRRVFTPYLSYSRYGGHFFSWQ